MRFAIVLYSGALLSDAVKAPATKKGSMVPKALRPAAAGIMGMLTGTAGQNPGHQETQAQLLEMMKNNDMMLEEFHKFAQTHDKSYIGTEQMTVSPAKGQEELYEAKYQAFKGNVAKAYAMNEASGGKTTFGVTKFSDLTQPEFKAQTKCMIPKDKNALAQGSAPKWTVSKSDFLATNGKYNKDWRDEGVISAVKDQQQCGSCWAFSTVETIESSVKQQFDEDWIGSPQQLVSCDHHGDMGCNGGLPTNAYKYLEKRPLDTEEYYPYKSGDGHSRKCHAKSKTHGVYEVESFQTVGGGATDEDAMRAYVGTKGPLSIGVDATAWQLYQGGVMTADTCDALQMDHAVQVVAINDDEGYWTVRNSWNTNWGEDGYIRLEVGKNTCLIADDATTAKVKKSSGGEEITV